MKNLVIAIYGHPESYPPTLNAIMQLSPKFSSIYVLYRPFFKQEWDFPQNVILIPSGQIMDIRTQEQSSLPIKVWLFLGFTFRLLNLIIRVRPKVVLFYDFMPLFSWQLIKRFIFQHPLVWYHNHDVASLSDLRKFSIGWFAKKNELNAFPTIDIFSLPSLERLKYFPMEKLKGKFFFLPNLPSLIHYNKFKKKIQESNNINLIYQGTVSKGHGLESIIKILKKMIHGKSISLHIAGILRQEYLAELNALINQYECNSQVIFHGRIPYKSLPELTSQCDIGIAINVPTDIIYQTGGTASNKIYEYAACGIPILYYDSEHYKKHLKDFDWAFATDLSPESLTNAIEQILDKYKDVSTSAITSFQKYLNFESNFAAPLAYLSEIRS